MTRPLTRDPFARAYPALPAPDRLAWVLWSVARDEKNASLRFRRCEDALRNIVFGDVVRTSKAREEYRAEALKELRRFEADLAKII